LVTQHWDVRVGTSQEPRTLTTLKCLDTSVLNTNKNHLITLLTDFCHFLNVTIEDGNVVPQSLWHYDPLTLWYMTSQQNKYPKPTELTKWLVIQNCKSDSFSKTFDLQPFFMKHIWFTWQPQKSL
jgi:hypothetical protein